FKGARPSIGSAPSSVTYGQVFFVGTPNAAAITGVNWVRSTSVTHATNMDQRMNRLSFSQGSGGLNVTAPSSSALCPPGPYMLFLLFSNGVPSTASVIRISSGGGSPPAAPSGLAATAVSGTQINLAWNDNSANEDGFKVERSTDGVNFTQIATLGIDAQSYSSRGLSLSTLYHHRVRAYNASGDSAYSNTASATTLASGGTGVGLRGEYHDNIDFTLLRLTRTDPTLDFDWGTGSPDPSIGADTYSVRWTGKVEPLYSQTYTFYTVTDDGVRLWVNDQLIIDKWIDQAPTEWSGAIALTALQQYDIRVEYYENGGGAVARLLWSSAGQAKEVVPQSQLYLPPAGSPPAAPSGLAAAAASKSQINLSWTDNSTNETSFKIERSRDNASFSQIAQVGANTTAYSDTGLRRNALYYYRVRASNASGDSAYSNTASARTLKN
ncbi:MAG: PA14 domain-containing protein, partial [Thermoanaerobaculia bacterium]